MMTSKLNEADPTIVDGPRAPAKNRLFSTSMMDSRISGADEPSAINVRLACVVSEKKAGRQWGVDWDIVDANQGIKRGAARLQQDMEAEACK